MFRSAAYTIKEAVFSVSLSNFSSLCFSATLTGSSALSFLESPHEMKVSNRDAAQHFKNEFVLILFIKPEAYFAYKYIGTAKGGCSYSFKGGILSPGMLKYYFSAVTGVSSFLCLQTLSTNFLRC